MGIKEIEFQGHPNTEAIIELGPGFKDTQSTPELAINRSSLQNLQNLPKLVSHVTMTHVIAPLKMLQWFPSHSESKTKVLPWPTDPVWCSPPPPITLGLPVSHTAVTGHVVYPVVLEHCRNRPGSRMLYLLFPPAWNAHPQLCMCLSLLLGLCSNVVSVKRSFCLKL